MTRLAFWGRCSTEDRQDPEASRAWQITRARALTEPRGGVIVAEYFDIDKSRSIPPQRRPEAALLLAELANPNRKFDAVVVGEPQRAFYGNQFGNTFPLFEHYGVPLWVPEVGGPIDPANEAHDMIMSTFGSISKGERSRIKTRVRTTMAALAQGEGRFLGGRPPYGYRLADAGPHPNPGKAADGKRLHVLEPDPATEDTVRWIFAEFLSGQGIYAIAEQLTRDGIPCPSAYDRARNRHRSGVAWSKYAVRAILLNPRYTGRQVWNRQRKDETLIDVHDVTLGHTTKLRWNNQGEWIWSDRQTHDALVSDEEFKQAQGLLYVPGGGTQEKKPRRTTRPYLFRGLIHCGVCERRMQGSWNNDKPHYRCVFPAEYALANKVAHPTSVYVRQELIAQPLDEWLHQVFRPAEFEASIEAMSEAQRLDDHRTAVAEGERQTIAECDRKLAQYRAALDQGGDPAVVSGWITEAQALRTVHEAKLREITGTQPQRMTKEEIVTLTTMLGDLLKILRSADAADKAEIYRNLGLHLTYDPGPRTVIARAEPGRSCTKVCPRGDHTRPHMAPVVPDRRHVPDHRRHVTQCNGSVLRVEVLMGERMRSWLTVRSVGLTRRLVEES